MKRINVGVIGMGWMGTVHSRSYNAIIDKFYDADFAPHLLICADNVSERVMEAKRRYGFAEATTKWMDVINHPDVDVVNITSPNFLHREMVLAAISAGKHVMCEKPVGVLPEDVAVVFRAAQAAGIMTFTGLNYRWAPLVQYAREMIARGQLGEITNYYGRFFAMYASDPMGQLSWRFQKEKAGTGALGDLMPHVADMAFYLVGPIKRVFSTRATSIKQRPLPVPGRGTHFSRGRPDDPMGDVTNEDYVGALLEFESGARGTLELGRAIFGPKVENRFEIYGTKGALRWNFETLNEMEIYLPDGTPERDGYVRILAGPDLPYYGRFQPGPGNNMSYDDLKVIEAYHFLRSVAEGRQYEPSFAAAYAFAQAHDAMMRSWESGPVGSAGGPVDMDSLTTTPFDLLTLGRCSLDLFAEQIGAPFVAIQSFSTQVGGSPTNIAIGASRLGLRTAAVTAVGNDPVGDFVRHYLAREGVATDFVMTKPGRTCLAVVGIEPPDKFPLVFYREAAPDRHIQISDIQRLPLDEDAMLLIAGSNFSTPDLRDASTYAARTVRERAGEVILDLDLRPHLWPQPAAYGIAIQSVWSMCNVVIGTEEELWGALSGTPQDVWAGNALTVAMRQRLTSLIRARQPAGQTIIVKRGSRGVTLFDSSGATVDVAGFPVTVLNTVGAGDAFAGGLLFGRRQEWTWPDALRFANACGAIVVTRHGCSAAMPTRSEVEGFLSAHDNAPLFL